MKVVPFKVWRFFRLWRVNYLVRKAEKQMESLRKFTAGHVTAYPYSMVFAALRKDIIEANNLACLLLQSVSYDEYAGKIQEWQLEKIQEQCDAVMHEATEFLASLGPDFLEKLEKE